MLITVFYIVVCVLLFALAILIHEFGHFIVALKLGLRVEAFSIGFGAALWKKRINGVEYRIGAIPLGGYVSIPDVDPEGTKALEGGGAADAAVRAKIPAWKELLVAVAGPFMNVVLAVVLAVALALVPGAKFGVVPLDVVRVLPGGPGEQAGLLPGDRILILDDFLANGAALDGLIDLVEQAGAVVVGAGIAIEKAFQPGGARIRARGCRVESLARIAAMDPETGIRFC